MRTLRPDFFLNEELSEVSIPAQFLLAGLWTVADREGRLEDRPRRIKAQVFPYREQIDVEELLSELTKDKHIIRYAVAGRAYIAITDWSGQRPHVKEAESVIPPPPDDYTEHHPGTDPAPSRQREHPGGFPAARDPSSLGSGILDPGSGIQDSAAPAGDGEGFALRPSPGADEKRRKAEERQREEVALEHRRKIRTLLGEGYKAHTGREYQSTKPAADNVAVEKLAALAAPEEIARRWRNLLAWAEGGFPAVASFSALTQHWNAIQVTDGVKKTSRAPVRANTTDWSDPSVENQRI
jgi:hypothetical protein